MISIGKVTGGAAGYSAYLSGDGRNAAAEYYSGENVPSQWTGTLAAQQGRDGEVTKESFVDALSGHVRDATGERIFSEERSNWLAGYDVTIGAPKSVSVEALVHGNTDALDAHRVAVAAAIEKLESSIGARVTHDGKTQIEQTGNMQAAQFEHHTSVTGDPHLHTHTVVVNTTACEDGKARAIDGKQSIYGQVNEIKETYHQALENSLETKGIATYRDDNGSPQIVGYDKAGMREFSERQRQMDANLRARGSSYDAATPQERELARQETRKDIDKPEPKSREAAQAAWGERAQAAREHGARIGPAHKSDAPIHTAEKVTEPRAVSREEFKDAKWTVNEGKTAAQRLESGNFRNADHRAQLERRIEKLQRLKEERPDLCARAEKAVARMGARDADAKIDAAAAERVKGAPAQRADRDAGELNTAKWVIGKGKDAQDQLDGGRVRSAAYKETLEQRVEKAGQLKSQNPDLYAKAEKVWDDEMTRARRAVSNARDAERQLASGIVFADHHREDLQQTLAAARELQDRQGALYAMATKAIERQSSQATGHAEMDGSNSGEAGFGPSGKAVKVQESGEKGDRQRWRNSHAENGQFRADVTTLRDADLAARALKSDSGLLLGFGKRELSAKDKSQMERVYNSRGDQFFVDKKGNVHSGLLNGQDPGAHFTKTDSLLGLGQKEYLVTEKGEVFVRGAGVAGGIAQRFANSLKSDGKGTMARVWNNTLQQAIGAKWEKASRGDTQMALKKANQVRKDYYDSRIELRRQLKQDVKEAVAGIAQRPQDMAKAFEAIKAHGQEVQIADKRAARQLEQARAEIKGSRTPVEIKTAGAASAARPESEKRMQQAERRAHVETQQARIETEGKVAQEARHDRRDVRSEMRETQQANQRIDNAAKAAIEKTTLTIAGVSKEATDGNQLRKEAERAKAIKNDRDATAAALRADSGIEVRTSEKLAAELQKAGGGQREQIENDVKAAIRGGRVEADKAAELVRMKVEEASGRATVDRQQREALQKTVDKGARGTDVLALWAAEDAKRELARMNKDATAKEHQRESAAMRAIVEKYGSPDQKLEYEGLEKASKDAFKTVEEKQRQAEQEHKDRWGY